MYKPASFPSSTTGDKLARDAYKAAVNPAGPDPRIITGWWLSLIFDVSDDAIAVVIDL